MKQNIIKLKKGIPKGTIIKDLYNDGVFFYKIGKIWYPTDFNNFKHSEFICVNTRGST